MITSLIDCSVKITDRAFQERQRWVGKIGQIVNIFVSGHSELKYVVMFVDEGKGELVNFYGTEFVVDLQASEVVSL